MMLDMLDMQEVLDERFHSTAWLMPTELEGARAFGRPQHRLRLFHYKLRDLLQNGPDMGQPARGEHTNLRTVGMLCTGGDYSVVLIRHARAAAFRLDGSPPDPRVLAQTTFELHVGMKRYVDDTLDQLTDEAYLARRQRDLELALAQMVTRSRAVVDDPGRRDSCRLLEEETAKATALLDPAALDRIPVTAAPGAQVDGILIVPTDIDVGSGYAVKLTLECLTRRPVL